MARGRRFVIDLLATFPADYVVRGVEVRARGAVYACVRVFERVCVAGG
jgi:hypothetical protein